MENFLGICNAAPQQLVAACQVVALHLRNGHAVLPRAGPANAEAVAKTYVMALRIALRLYVRIQKPLVRL